MRQVGVCSVDQTGGANSRYLIYKSGIPGSRINYSESALQSNPYSSDIQKNYLDAGFGNITFKYYNVYKKKGSLNGSFYWIYISKPCIKMQKGLVVIP